MAKKTKKPVGTSGVTRITRTDAGHHAEFQKVSFPNDKEAIEEDIVKGFIASARPILPQLAESSYAQNKQDDFDFDLLLADGSIKHLELKEIAPLDRCSYEDAASSYIVYDFAMAIRHMIQKQSRRYEGSTGPGLYLLLYVTDWRFYLSESVVMLLRYWAVRDEHCFQRIYVFQVREKYDGLAEVVYPEAVPVGFDPNSLRQNRVRNGDPTKWQEIPGGGIGPTFSE